MYNFIFFISGIIFIMLIQPIISSLSEIVITWLDLAKCKTSLKIAQYAKQIQSIECDESKTRTIGFQIEEDYEDEDL